MGFIGLIRLIALVFAVWLLWRFAQRRRIGNDTPEDKSLQQSMVQCKLCGTHVPEADAIKHKDNWYCCIEHQEEDNR